MRSEEVREDSRGERNRSANHTNGTVQEMLVKGEFAQFVESSVLTENGCVYDVANSVKL